MSDAPTDLDALALVLDETSAAIALAAMWQTAVRGLPPSCPPKLYEQVIGEAVKAEDVAHAAANRLRERIGVPLLPDPAEPPPARPDEA